MIGFEELNERDQQIALLEMAIRDAHLNLKYIADQIPEMLLNHLNELDELIELAGVVAENGIRAVGIKMESGE